MDNLIKKPRWIYLIAFWFLIKISDVAGPLFRQLPSTPIGQRPLWLSLSCIIITVFFFYIFIGLILLKKTAIQLAGGFFAISIIIPFIRLLTYHNPIPHPIALSILLLINTIFSFLAAKYLFSKKLNEILINYNEEKGKLQK